MELLAGRWNCIRGDPRYRFHPSRTAANLQQKGKLLCGVTAAIDAPNRSLRQLDPKLEPSYRREALAAGVGGSAGSVAEIGFGVTDVSCDDSGSELIKRARLQTEQSTLVRR